MSGKYRDVIALNWQLLSKSAKCIKRFFKYEIFISNQIFSSWLIYIKQSAMMLSMNSKLVHLGSFERIVYMGIFASDSI